MRLNGVFAFCLLIIIVDGKVYISNFNELCFQCLCDVHGCEWTRGCSEGYCGPFYMPKVYWADAGKPTLAGDDPNTQEGYENCAQDKECALTTVTQYLTKYGKDCNKDGVTDCYDYMMINYNGGPNCSPPLNRSEDGAELVTAFKQCRL